MRLSIFIFVSLSLCLYLSFSSFALFLSLSLFLSVSLSLSLSLSRSLSMYIYRFHHAHHAHHAHTPCTHTMYTHSRACKHTCTHSHSRTHTHTHTHARTQHTCTHNILTLRLVVVMSGIPKHTRDPSGSRQFEIWICPDPGLQEADFSVKARPTTKVHTIKQRIKNRYDDWDTRFQVPAFECTFDLRYL